MDAVSDHQRVFMRGRNRSGRVRGFSLIELMVALTLSLVVLGGVVSIFMSSRTTYETTERLSRVQDNGRFALDTLVRDLRSAGYMGCSRVADFTNALNTPDELLWNFAVAVQGFDAQGNTWRPELDTGVAINAVAGSDALVVRTPRPDVEPVRVVEGSLMLATNDDVETEDSGETRVLDAGEIVQISDCQGRSVFQVTNNTAGVIQHAAGEPTNGLPGNASDEIGYAFTDAAELLPVQSVVYYLGSEEPAEEPAEEAGDPVQTSLYRRVSGSTEAEELVEGVESMQFEFGQLVGGTIQYRRADQVTDWRTVLTVRIALLVRSTSQYGTDVDTATYDLLGAQVVAPGDRHLRQVFTTTVGIRNVAN